MGDKASKEACHEDYSLITPTNLMDLMVSFLFCSSREIFSVVVLVNRKEPFHFLVYTSNIQQSTYDGVSVEQHFFCAKKPPYGRLN